MARKGKIEGAEETAEPIGESKGLGSLRERNATGGSGNIPNRTLSRPFVGNARANFAAKNVEIKLEIGAFFINSRPVDGDGLKIEATGEIHPTATETLFLPFSPAAQLR